MKLASILLYLVTTGVLADPAVWHVSGENGELWLLGSIHYLRDQDYPLPAVIDELYAQADTLVMELDLDDLDALAVQGSFMSAGVLPETTDLADVLDAEIYGLAIARAAELGLPSVLLDRLEPWLVALTLMDLGMSELGYESSQGLEHYLLRRAAEDGKEIAGLELLQDQVDIFDALAWEDQSALLMQTLSDLDDPEENMTRLLDAWRNGSLDELAMELRGDFQDFPELETALIGTRNSRWAVKLEQLLAAGGRRLVVVGALHLVGDDSVIQMLSERGMTVARYTSP